MLHDPVVASVRQVRESLAAAFDYDVQAIFADLRKREAASTPHLLQPRGETKSVAQPPVLQR